MNGPLRRLAAVIVLLFGSLLISATWVQFVDADDLNDDGRNSRTLFQDLGRERGPILVNSDEIARSEPSKDDSPYAFKRVYPGGPQYSHLAGYFSVVYGPAGMEDAAGDYLSGRSGQLFYRRIGDLLSGKEPEGAAVELTINPKAQKAAWDALGDRKGAVVALDPKTGDVLAMVSKPSFDPDDLASHDRRAVAEAWEKLNADDDKPLVNRALLADYFPGSVFKIVTSAAALSSGMTPDSEVPGPAVLDLPQTTKGLPNDFSGACGPGGRTTLANALRISCNTAYGAIGMELGADALDEQAKKFGFDQQGLKIPLSVYPSKFPQGLNAPQTAQSAIGQFDVKTSPLQVAMISAGVANDGVVMRPNLIRAIRDSKLEEVGRQPSPEKLSEAMTPEVADQLTEMMKGVVESGSGTRAQVPGVQVAGKTGSAQTGVLGGSPYAWFTAFAPADDPQIAIAVVVEEGGDAASGGRVAAPVAQDVLEAVLRR